MFSPLFLALASYVPVRAESIITDNTVLEVTPTVEPTVEPKVEPTLSPLPTPTPLYSGGQLYSPLHKTPTPTPLLPSPTPVTEPITVYGSCMEDLADENLNCTAEDVTIAAVTNIQILDDGCAYPGDTVTFKATWEIASNSTERYDIGLYFSSDGDPNHDGAMKGSCSISTLPNSPNPPWWDLDSDSCGDIKSSYSLKPELTLTVSCLDTDSDNQLNVPYATSWDNQAGAICSGPLTAVPSTKSKCKSDIGFEIPITVPYGAKIEVVKDLIPSNDPGRFNLSIIDEKTVSNVGDNGTTGIVDVGAGTSANPGATYTITEEAYTGTNLSDYSTSISCVDRKTGGIIKAESDNSLDLTVNKDQSILCTVTNSRKSGELIVAKNLINDNGGKAVITDFAFSVNGGANTYFEADGSNSLTLTSGTYSIVESVTKPGYKVTYNNCTDIEVVPGQTATCTITNDDIAPSLILNKVINNDNGGTALESNWTLKATGTGDAPTNLSGVGAVGTYDVVSGLTFKADTYTLSEVADPGITGYSASEWSCAKNNDKPVLGGSITLGLGDTAICTITNDDIAPSLTLIKEVKNDNGGKAVAADWTLTATGPTTITGTTGVTSDSSFKAGTYVLSESSKVTGYKAMGWTCEGGLQDDDEITLKAGESATCTITNDDIQPKLTVNKIVKGGTALEGDFELYVTLKDTTIDTRVYDEVSNGFDAGTFVISEKNIAGYTASFLCDGQETNEITLNVGDDKLCSITNTRDEGKLTVYKLTDTDADGDYDYDSTQSNTLGFRWGYLGSTTDNTFGSTDILETGSYNVVENSVKDYHLVSWFVKDGANDSCDKPDGYAVASAIANVNVVKGEITELYFCNVRDTGTLQAKKTLDDQSKLSDWSFSIDGGTTKYQADPDTGLVSFGSVLTNTKYVITEYGPAGYKVSTITGDNCTQVGDTAEAVVPSLGGSTTCVFNNLINKASLTIIKDALPNDPTVFEFSALDNISYDQKLPATFNLDDDGNNSNTYSNTKIFEGLFPGEFSVSEKTVTGWKLTDITCSSATQRFSVKDNQEVKFSLSPGESMTCTFTNTKLGEVKALKFEDLNGDGDFTKEELPYLGGWEMTLFAGFDCQGTPLAVQTTQADGPAVFSGLLPGIYSIKETMQSDWMTTDGLCRNYTITAGQEQSQKFGNFRLFDITGTKYEDRNKDGDQNAQELGIQGWTVKLYKWNNGTYQYVTETVTDVNGWYKFMDLGPGSYKVMEESKDGWEFVNPATGYHTFTAISGVDKDLDFGNVSKAKIIVDKVTIPSRDPQSFQFKLSDQSGVLQNFSLADQTVPKTLDVQRGTYTIAENTPAGWMLSSVLCLDDAGLPVDVAAITLDPDETVRCAFTNTKLGSIKVEKIAQPEDSEMFDFKITGGVNETFQLQDNGHNSDGYKDYKRFNNVEPVEYTISEGLESEWKLIELTCDSDMRREISSSDQSITFTLKPGEDITCKFTNEKYSQIKVLKFNDYLGEGVYGPLDTPIANWGMQLYSGKDCSPANKIGAMEYTDVKGEYRFTELLHGWYSVKEATDPAWTNTTPLCQNTYLVQGDYDKLAFGNFKLGKVEGYKYDDVNKDKDWDSDEPAVSGWKVKLYRDGHYYSQTWTDESGYYSFTNLGPGVYKVVEEERDGWKAINPEDGDYHFMLISGETKRLDFGNFSWGKIILDKDTLPEGSNEKFTLNILQNGEEIIDHRLKDKDIPSKDYVSTRFTYSVTEDEKSGWELSSIECQNNWGKDKDPSGFTLKPGEEVRCEFTNTLLGKLKVVKYSDDNGNGIFEPSNGENKLPGWGMNLESTDNVILEKSTDEMGEAFFNDLQMGHYVLSEDQQDGWELTGIYCENNTPIDYRPRSIDTQTIMPIDAEHMDVYPGFDYTCYVGNQELGEVVVTKFNDVNGDGIWQQGKEEELGADSFSLNNMIEQYSEEVLEGWTIHMQMVTDNVIQDVTHLESNGIMPVYSEVTDSNGQAFFLDMPISKYRLYETQQEGWTLTNIYCELDQEVNGFGTTALLRPIEDEDYAGDYQLDLKAGQSYHCYVGNQISELYIDKTNDATAPLTLGDTTTFTIMVTLPDQTAGGYTPAMLNDLMVKDLFSKGFKYIVGSNKVWVNGVPIVAPVPTYNSPGTWDLSSLTLEGGDEVKIQYQVEMVDPLNEGTYKDTAWAEANTAETSNQVLALDINDKDFFVGTEVKVAQVLEPQEVTIPEEELPRTGSNIMILVASTALAGFGFALVLLGLAKKYASRKAFKFLMTLIGVPMVMAIAAFMGAATAYALPYLDLQVQDQPALTSLSEFDITFVTMDLQGNDITATCYYNYDPVAPASFDTTNPFIPSIGSDFGTGNSGACQITPVMTQFDGYYAFTVKVETATETETKTVNIEIDRNKPLQPVTYTKTAIDTCNNRIDFQTAADARTAGVDIFRSTVTSFIADDTTRVASIVIGPGASGSYTDTVPVCGTTYYYVIQAVDAYGNRSPFKGDQIVTIIDNTTGGGTTTNGGTTAGGVAGEGTTAGGEEGTGAEVTPSGITIDTDENGNVLGGTTDNTGAFNYTTFWVVIIAGLAVLGGIVYALSKKK
jgi:hypothetical protein